MSGLTPQQELAVTSIDRNVIVSAGAGSGKTHVLVERYIELLRCTAEVSVSNIVAITYTRKAAAEMRTRLKARMQKLMLDTAGDEQSRWAQCYAEVDGARIVTIHSLCESLLRAYPTEANIDPQFELVDDVEQCKLTDESISDAFRQVIEAESEEIELLMRQNIDEVRSWIQSALRSSTQFRESLSIIGVVDENELWIYAQSRLEAEQERALGELARKKDWRRNLSYVGETPWKDRNSPLEQMRVSMSGLAQESLDLSQSVSERWSKLVEVAALRFGRYGGGEAAELKAAMKQVQVEIAALVDAIPACLNDQDKEAFRTIKHLIQLTKLAGQSYKNRKKSILKLDYNDLIELAVNTLSAENSSARQSYTAGIRAILVDEFQDTNAQQSSLVKLLASSKANLFLIGDDKQSIYKFQGADVSTFNKWKAEFAQTDCQSILSLSQSFRSHPTVVAFINAVFAEILAKPTPGTFDATFVELSAARQEHSDPERVQIRLLPAYDDSGDKLKTSEIQAVESQAVAAWIAECIEKQLPVKCKTGDNRAIQYGDFAVLVQQNKDFANIEFALASAGIPYVTLGGQGFLERQEIYDMQNLLAFLSNPRDSQALVGILRSPIFGITDDIIHLIGTSGYRGQPFWQKLKEMVARRHAGYESVAAAGNNLSRWIEDAGCIPVNELLRRIIQATSYDIVLLSLPNGHQRSRNLWKLVHVATQNEHMTCSQFVEHLKQMREFRVKQADAPLDNGSAVKLMTIHSSKGLEFPAVALPILGKSAVSRANKFRFHRHYGLAINTCRDGENKPAWYQLASAYETEMEVSEKRRLFYVAMTRARDYLSLFMPTQRSKTESFLSWMQNVLQIDSDEEAAKCTRTLTSLDHQASYTLVPFAPRTTDRCEVFQPALDFDQTALANHETGLNLSLIGSLQQELPKEPLPWFGWTRVTPEAGGVKIGATISGTYFHALMEHLSSLDDPTAEQIESIAYAQGDVAAHPDVFNVFVSEGQRLLQIFQHSQLHSLLRTSKRHLHELPYTLLEAEGAIVRRPDLLIETDDGSWLIVDYKTDKFEVGTLAQQANKHRLQLKQYVDEFRTLTGISATPCLYFAEHGILHGLPEQVVQLSLLSSIAIS